MNLKRLEQKIESYNLALRATIHEPTIEAAREILRSLYNHYHKQLIKPSF